MLTSIVIFSITFKKQKKGSKKQQSAEEIVESKLKEERKQALKEGKRPYFMKKGIHTGSNMWKSWTFRLYAELTSL